MRRKLLKASLLALVVGVASTVLVGAQGGDSLTFATSFTFQNLEDTTATVHLDFYDTAGNKVAQSDESVPNSAAFYAPNYAPLNGINAFSGGILASSDKRLASIANQQAINSTTGKTNNATYSGFTNDEVAATMYAPIVMKNFAGYYTEASVQSTGGDITVNVEYFDDTGKVGATRTVAVKANSPARIPQAADAGLPNNWIGSMKVSAADGTTKIALVVNEFVGVSGAMYNQFYSYEGFAGGANNVSLPSVFINGYGSFQASASIQNLGTTTANVTMKFYDNTPGNSTPGTVIHTENLTIDANKSHSVYFPNAPYANTLINAYQPGDNAWVGAINIESDQPVIATANQLQGTHQASAYRGLVGGGSEISFPIAFANAYGFANTSLTIADVNGTGGEIDVTIEYLADTTECPTCTDQTFSNVKFTNALALYQPNHITTGFAPGTNTFIGSAKITVNTPGAKINGIMNELLGGDTADNFTSFNATIITP